MNDSFNPYREWLELDLPGGTPTHYQLLDLEPYEADTQRIAVAADRALSRVRGFRPGVHASHWARLLDQLSEAKSCLTNPQRKSEYDQELRTRPTTPSAPASSSPSALASLYNPPGFGEQLIVDGGYKPPLASQPVASSPTPAPGMMPPMALPAAMPVAMPAAAGPTISPASPTPTSAPVGNFGGSAYGSSPPTSTPASPYGMAMPMTGGFSSPSPPAPAPEAEAAILPDMFPPGAAPNYSQSWQQPNMATPAGPGYGSASSAPASPYASPSGPAAPPASPPPAPPPASLDAIPMAIPVGPAPSWGNAGGYGSTMPAAAMPASTGAGGMGYGAPAMPEYRAAPSGDLPDPMAPIVLPESWGMPSQPGAPAATPVRPAMVPGTMSSGMAVPQAAAGGWPAAPMGTPMTAKGTAAPAENMDLRAGRSSAARAMIQERTKQSSQSALFAAVGAGLLVLMLVVIYLAISSRNRHVAEVPPEGEPGAESTDGGATTPGGTPASPPVVPSNNNPPANSPPNADPIPVQPPLQVPPPMPPTRPVPSDNPPPVRPQPMPVTPPVRPTPTPMPTPPPVVVKPPPVTPPTPEELEAMFKSLASARTALGGRNFDLAAEEIKKAEALAKLPEHKQMVARLGDLRSYVLEFWRAVGEGMKGLDAGSELKIGNTYVVVVEVGPDLLIVRVAGQNKRYPLNGIPSGLAMIIADKWFDQKAPGTMIAKGALRAVDPNGDVNDARKLWQDALAAGAPIQQLMPVLDDKYE